MYLCMYIVYNTLLYYSFRKTLVIFVICIKISVVLFFTYYYISMYIYNDLLSLLNRNF